MLTPTAGNSLLDSNMVIAFFAQEPAVLKHVSDASQIFVPVIVLGELYFGARKSGRVAENVRRIDEFAELAKIFNCDLETARYFGEIQQNLRTKGRPIPENDMWIAAVAMQHGLTLVTRDAHFDEINGLTVARWYFRRFAFARRVFDRRRCWLGRFSRNSVDSQRIRVVRYRRQIRSAIDLVG